MSLSSTGVIASPRSSKVDFDWDLFLGPKHPRSGKRGGTVDDLLWVVVNTTKAPDAAWKANLFVAEKWAQDLLYLRQGEPRVSERNDSHAGSIVA